MVGKPFNLSIPPDQDWLIEPELWSRQDQTTASMEGWVISCSNEPGSTTICKLAEVMRWLSNDVGIVRPFLRDQQAREFVAERAHQGSSFHERALIALAKAVLHGAVP